jgi:D-alanine-D-alanine ligase
MLDLPYVGPGVTTSAVAMDKLLCKQVLQAAGLPVVAAESLSRAQFRRWASSGQGEEALPVTPSWPCFVKPCVGGSSVGISRVGGPEDLPAALELALRFDDRCLVEDAVEGRELECALIGWEQLEASRPGEIVPGNDFYDYADKYLLDGAQLIAPAPLDTEAEARLASLACAAFEALGGWGMARVDFFLQEDGSLFVNEINTIPGFTDISMYPRLWEISGLPLPALVDRLVAIAFDRHRDRRELDRGIASWMASLQAP